MSPLALIPIGLYAITATVGAEIAIENAETAADEPEQKVTDGDNRAKRGD